MFHNEWLKARKKLLDQTCSQVSLLSGSLTRDLKTYSRAYKNEFKAQWRHSSQKDFLAELESKSLLLGGDFHAFSQSQRLHLRILRSLKRPLVLGLECIESRHQKWIEKYQAGEIIETVFLEKVQWEKRWGFPWENYKPLFDWARANKVLVFGLNRHESKPTQMGFKRRDTHAALRIKQLCDKYPSSLIYVIFGDLHIAQSHLPKALTKAFGFDPRPLILFQNPEELYFRLAKKGKATEVDWLATSRGRFCHLSSPPWVKWQSYLMFLEKNFDRDLDAKEDELDLTDQVGILVDFLCKELSVKVPIEELAVYSPGQLSFEKLMNKNLTPQQKKIAFYLVQEDRSFLIPQVGLMYLSRLSINHASALAGCFVHAHLCKRRRVYWNQPEDFQQAIWIEAVGFFFSKLINHSRKAENLRSLKARLVVAEKKNRTKEALEMALDQRMVEVIYAHTGRLRALRNKKRQTAVFLEAARITGEMMGEKLYQNFTQKGVVKQSFIKYLRMNLDSNEFSEMYLQLVKKMENVHRPSLVERSAVATW